MGIGKPMNAATKVVNFPMPGKKTTPNFFTHQVGIGSVIHQYGVNEKYIDKLATYKVLSITKHWKYKYVFMLNMATGQVESRELGYVVNSARYWLEV